MMLRQTLAALALAAMLIAVPFGIKVVCEVSDPFCVGFKSFFGIGMKAVSRETKNPRREGRGSVF